MNPPQQGIKTAAQRAAKTIAGRYVSTPHSGTIGQAAMAKIISDEYASIEQDNQRLREALKLYADPESYTAISFLCDEPCGAFAYDFDDEHGHENFNRPMPGKRARQALATDTKGGG